MKIYCKHCGKEIETNNGRKIFCSKKCKEVFNSKKKFQGTEGIDYVECKECGIRATDLTNHLKSSHGVDEYCEKYGCKKSDLFSQKTKDRKRNAQIKAIKEGKGNRFTSENNPSKLPESKTGINSPFSMNFRGYAGLSDEEKREKIEQLKKSARNNMQKNGNNPLTIEYYLKRGLTEDEAKEKLKERQSTFSLEKCTEKYGKKEGKKRWEERQQKWQNTLNNLPVEEQERIAKAKMFYAKSFSEISQKLFRIIDEKLNGKYKEIYYATNNPNKKDNEYMVIDPATKQKYFLDFYVKDINKVIEFDGDYWHGEKRGNAERDRIREENLIRLGYKILHVKERDFRNNPDKVISECIDFLRDFSN